MAFNLTADFEMPLVWVDATIKLALEISAPLLNYLFEHPDSSVEMIVKFFANKPRTITSVAQWAYPAVYSAAVAMSLGQLVQDKKIISKGLPFPEPRYVLSPDVWLVFVSAKERA